VNITTANGAQACEELSRCFGMLAVIMRRKDSTLERDMNDAGVYWTRVHTAWERLRVCCEQAKAMQTARGRQ
jgi:hypothetical protein